MGASLNPTQATFSSYSLKTSTVNTSVNSLLILALEHDDPVAFAKLHQDGAWIQYIPLELYLHQAVSLSKLRIAKYLLSNPAFFSSKNMRNSDGRTPLHIAAYKADAQMVALLLKHNADPGIKDYSDKTPQDIASETNLPETEDILEQFSAGKLIVKLPNSSRQAISELQRDLTRTTLDSQSEKSASLLEKALKQSKLPLIPVEELKMLGAINRGSSCVVLRGKWRGSRVAIKKFKPEYSFNIREALKFIQEMQILSQVRHPHIMLVMGICWDKPHLCLVSEMAENGSLFQAIHKNKHQPLSLEQRLRIAVQITQALLFLHTSIPPIVHRDLKPENCLLDSSFNAKIADFGLALPETRLRESQNAVCIGTTRFMAPELFETSAEVGPKLDIWALGCTFINLFGSVRPWGHIPKLQTKEIYYQIVQQRPIPIPQIIPEGIRRIIEGCCRYKVSSRLTSSEVLDQLLNFQYQPIFNFLIKVIDDQFYQTSPKLTALIMKFLF